MGNLIWKYACCLTLVVFCFSTAALADQVTLTYTGGGPTGPYSVEINGSPTTMICDSADLYVTENESWTANGVSVQAMLNNNSLMPTQVWDSFASNLTLSEMLQRYEEAAWLALQMYATTDPTQQAEIQQAIWYVTSGSGNGNYGDWVTEAQNAVAAGGINYNDVTVYTYNGGQITGPEPPSSDPTPQEFLYVAGTPVPEPPTAPLVGIGLVSMLGLMVFYRRSTVFGNSN